MIARLATTKRLFHSYIRKINIRCPSVGPLRLECGEVAEAFQMSERSVESFSSVFVTDAPVVFGEHHRLIGDMEDIFVSPFIAAKVL